jgi:hypothetical protein
MAIDFPRAFIPGSLVSAFKTVAGILDEDTAESVVMDNNHGYSVLLIQFLPTGGTPTITIDVSTDENVSFVPLNIWDIEGEIHSATPPALTVNTLFSCNVTGARYVRVTKSGVAGTKCTYTGRFHKNGTAHTAITKQFA